MSTTLQRTLAWSGVAFIVCFFSGMLICGWIPPVAPDHTAAEVARIYASSANRIRLGLVIMLVGGGFAFPFVAIIGVQMKRIEGRFSPLCYTQLVAGAANAVAITLPLLIFMAASYRPERNPTVTQTLNDLGWIPFIINIMPATVQILAIAAATFRDKRADPIFPRWIGYFNVWVAVLLAPGLLIIFFKDGLFAWNGLVGFWVGAGAFGSWFLVMTWALLRAANVPDDVSVEGSAVAPAREYGS